MKTKIIIMAGLAVTALFVCLISIKLMPSSVLNSELSQTSTKTQHENSILFNWENYADVDDAINELRIILPKGDSRSHVEQVLMKSDNKILRKIINISEHIQKTGGQLVGPLYDKILYEDPEFFKVTTMIIYSVNGSKKFLPSTAASPDIIVFYDKDNKLLNVMAANKIVHIR